jgi:hypothetical protein
VLWSSQQSFRDEEFESESELEAAIVAASSTLFGTSRYYLNVKKKIGIKGGTRNIPDGYLIDLTSAKEPRLYVVEVELARHDPLKHIAVQILQFSLSFETDPPLVKNAIRDALVSTPAALTACATYAGNHGFENVDRLLEAMIYGKDQFNALVIIDELSPDLETVLQSRFKFPVEILTLRRFKSAAGQRLYEFEPFLEELSSSPDSTLTGKPAVDPSEIDTIVVPARESGFQEVFLEQNAWWSIRIHSSMLGKIQFIAAYRTAPESAITHVAPVRTIKPYKDSGKYLLEFAAPATPVGPIRLVPGGTIKAPQAPRYTSRARLLAANTLDEAF